VVSKKDVSVAEQRHYNAVIHWMSRDSKWALDLIV